MEGHLPLLQMLEAQNFYMAHKVEYLWGTRAVNFIGARFVEPYFIKSNPGGWFSMLCLCVQHLISWNKNLHYINLYSRHSVCAVVEKSCFALSDDQ